jgi:hypothetical protein
MQTAILVDSVASINRINKAFNDDSSCLTIHLFVGKPMRSELEMCIRLQDVPQMSDNLVRIHILLQVTQDANRSDKQKWCSSVYGWVLRKRNKAS